MGVGEAAAERRGPTRAECFSACALPLARAQEKASFPRRRRRRDAAAPHRAAPVMSGGVSVRCPRPAATASARRMPTNSTSGTANMTGTARERKAWYSSRIPIAWSRRSDTTLTWRPRRARAWLCVCVLGGGEGCRRAAVAAAPGSVWREGAPRAPGGAAPGAQQQAFQKRARLACPCPCSAHPQDAPGAPGAAPLSPAARAAARGAWGWTAAACAHGGGVRRSSPERPARRRGAAP
jgi:hypothetical protein